MTERSVQTIHVPDGWSVEQTWEQISNGQLVPVRPGEWVSVEVEDMETSGDRVVAGRFVRRIDGSDD